MNKLIHWATVKQVGNVARGKIEFIEYQPLSIGPQKEKIQCELILAKMHTKCALRNIGPDFGTRDSGFDPWQQKEME